MGNRGQKRTETVEGLPADKRPCSSLEFRPSSSNSSIHTEMNYATSMETQDAETQNAETQNAEIRGSDIGASSGSASSHSEDDEPERDSAYDSCDSDDQDPRHSRLENIQRERSSGDHGKLKTALSSLSESTDPSALLASLTELCELLSFCTEDSFSSTMADSLSPVLVQLARHETNADIMLLAIRALSYLCDVFPQASIFLVKHDAVAALCQRLAAIEYLDVAEQCFQALEKISRYLPLPCLQAGAITAVLSYIDFFSTSVQREALSTVVNICRKLPADNFSPFMEAVPMLCNILQYEDPQLVENAAISLIKIAERVSQSSEMLDELCKHGLVNQATHLIQFNSGTTLSQPIYNGLIGLLAKLSCGSTMAFRNLYDLNISSILKNILATYDLSHGVSSPNVINGQGNQVHEVLKLLNELLPNVARDKDVQEQGSDKESFLIDHPDLLHKLASDMLPMLVQVVNSGANLYVCYGCLRVIKKLAHFSQSDLLVELLKNVNMPSFLAGLFTRKDNHVLLAALEITEIILLKLSDVFLDSFIKEGVLFSIDAHQVPESCSQFMFAASNDIHLPCDSGRSLVSKVSLRCLCYAFDTAQYSSAAEKPACKLENDSVQKLSTQIRTSYFSSELCDSQKGLTDTLQKLRALSSELSNLTSVSACIDSLTEYEEKCYRVLHQIVAKLDGREPVSTFEFIESGVVKSLVNYISNGRYLRGKAELHDMFDDYCIEKRFEAFAMLFLSSSNHAEELPLLVLARKLQCALSSLENFPVILSHTSNSRSSFAVVPSSRATAYPCLSVRFVKGEGETCLSEYSDDAVKVDPLASLDAIEEFLLPKVTIKKTEVESSAKAMDTVETAFSECPSNTNSSEVKSSDPMELDSMSTGLPDIQEDGAVLAHSLPDQAVILQENPGETALNETHIAPPEHTRQLPSRTGTSENSPASCSKENNFPRLVFYLEGKPLNKTLTIYQAILQQNIKANVEIDSTAKLWSQVCTLTYRMAVESKDDIPQDCVASQNSAALGKIGSYVQQHSFFSSIFSGALTSSLDNSCPTYDILFLLKSLEGLNKFVFHVMSRERVHAFSQDLVDNLNDLEVVVRSVSQNEFVNSKLTEKLEQQMRDSLALSVGGMPLWCNQLIASFPFLFSFEARSKYFRLSAFGPQQVQPQPSRNNSGVSRDRRPHAASLARKKFLVLRERILESASQMMEVYACVKVPIEVVYNEEVGTGLGPTLEFYTLVSHEFQKSGLGMWRQDHISLTMKENLHTEGSGMIASPCGLFPCPWPATVQASNGIEFSEVTKKFFLLGQVVAKALQDGRVLDIPLSKAFYKLILRQELNLYDIPSFDPELGRTLVEFQAIITKRDYLDRPCGETSGIDRCFRNMAIEDLCLDFTLPGNPDYILTSREDCRMVNMTNLEEYVTLVVDATIRTGICRQVEAFKSGFNQVFPIDHLQIFTEEELERLLCGERDFWAFNELLDHIKFDHGYTASSPPVINLLEILEEFKHEERKAFLQFVTGAPRLPPGGLASLNPKLTIVRKHSSNCVDADLPSVMTCANYLKLPPYSSKDKMRERLMYAITEGQGSFHLS